MDASHFVVAVIGSGQGTQPVAFGKQVSVNSKRHGSLGSASARNYSENTISYRGRNNSDTFRRELTRDCLSDSACVC